MKTLRKSKNKKFFSILEFLYPSIILSAVFFGLFFFGLNHFYGNKMDYFQKNTIKITGKLRLALISDKLLDAHNAKKNDQTLFYVDELKKANDQRYVSSSESEMQFYNLVDGLGNNKIPSPGAEQIIFSEVINEIKQYKSKEFYCEKIKIQKIEFLNGSTGGFRHILKVEYNLEDKPIALLVLNKNIQEEYKNKSNLCHKNIENLAIEKLEEAYKEVLLMAHDMKTVQIASLKNQTHYNSKIIEKKAEALGGKTEIDQYVKKSVLEILYDDLKKLDFLIDVKNKTKLFKIQFVKEEIDISFGRGNYINKYSIFFIISLLISIVFFITTQMLKKIFYKF